VGTEDELRPGKVLVDESVGNKTRSLILQVDRDKVVEAIEIEAIGEEPPETIGESPKLPTRVAIDGRDTFLTEMEEDEKESIFGGTEDELLEQYHER